MWVGGQRPTLFPGMRPGTRCIQDILWVLWPVWMGKKNLACSKNESRTKSLYRLRYPGLKA